MTELELRQSTIEIMRSWLGGKQGSTIHREIVDTYNSHRPLPRGHVLTMDDAWCAATVSAAAIRAGLTDIMPVECSCTRMIELYKALGRWVEDDGYIPTTGDLILYDWEDSGKGDCTGQPNHVGMVEAVSGLTMTVIEGNYDSAVRRRTLKVNGRYIRGFACPDYASKAAGGRPTPENGGNDMDYEQFKEYMERYRAELQARPGSVSWGGEDRAWAEQTGLFRGGTNGEGFMWQDFLTREQAAALFHREAKRTGNA